MKRICVVGVLIGLALWLGLSLGYHFGKRNERTAWESTRVAVLDSDDAPAVVQTVSSTRGGGQTVMTDARRHPRRALHVYYSNPHGGILIEEYPGHVENVPDPRSTPVKGR